MKIDDVKCYLEKSKRIWDLSCMAIDTIHKYLLTSEFKNHLTIQSQKKYYLKIDCYGYNLIFEAEMNWEEKCPRSIIKASHQFSNNKNLLEEETLLKYYIDNNGFVYDKPDSKDNIGHVGGEVGSDFQETFIADVFSKIIMTDKIKAV